MKKITTLLLLFTFTILTAFNLNANFVDSEGIEHYGWDVIADEENLSNFEFNEEGYISNISAASGDISSQRVNMYALRNLELSQEEEYSVSVTVTPDEESDTSVERAYGILPWYIDGDNYLIYWLQQKTDGAWSGQFYGRINGVIKKNINNVQLADDQNWTSNEYNDMWWDDARFSHPTIRGVREALLDTTVTLKVVSKIETITVGGVEWTGRSFELHQIIGGEDFVSSTYYVDGVAEVEEGFKTGIYTEAFNIGLEDYTLESETDFVLNVESEINKLNLVTNDAGIQEVSNARVNFKGLLNEKADVNQTVLDKLVATEKSAASYIDGLITKLNIKELTFVDDVKAVEELHLTLSEEILGHVKETEALIKAINDAKDWKAPVDPEEPEEPEKPGENEEKPKNSTLPIIIISSVVGVLLLAGGTFLIIKRKKS